jgi:hypothetical protein
MVDTTTHHVALKRDKVIAQKSDRATRISFDGAGTDSTTKKIRICF